jgi:GT2 family glycosyltransferase
MENKKNFFSRRIENDVLNKASVEIIIPFHDQHSHVLKLIQSIFNTVYTNKYLITLVDDGSVNKSFIKSIEKKKIPGVRCLQQEKKGFGAAVNYALKNPYQLNIPWVVIMHSDVVVETNNWLPCLLKTMNSLKDKGIKMVSPKTNNPVVDFDFLKGEKGVKDPDYILDEGFLPMYCALAHRQLFQVVGLFKEYPYAGVEVEDFSVRMKKLNLKQAVSGSSWVHHTGCVTLDKFKDNRKVQEILKKSKQDFEASFLKTK